jgi:hypothetical protein
MPLEQTQCFCRHCQTYTLAQRKGVNNLVHALVTLFLCGLWVPVWIIACFMKEPYRCTRCGTRKG